MKPRQKLTLILSLSLVFLVTLIATLSIIINGKKTNPENNTASENQSEQPKESEATPEESPEETPTSTEAPASLVPDVNPTTASLPGGNCTTPLGKLMLINANFTVDSNFISGRRNQLIDLTATYDITEANSWNGVPLLDSEAASHLNDMIAAYQTAYPGHTMQTMSCFRSYGTSCGRLCAPTGTSEHHSGYTCDLIDTAYGNSLDTDYYAQHIDWQWLKQNSYKYGFIDRYPLEWAGSSMSEPLNVNANGTTGYYETWHYRYVGIPAATEIATGKYNNGAYDSLEHYLKSLGLVKDLQSGICN